jgi:hypothetical protein
MKKIFSLLILGTTFASYANLDLNKVKGNSCIVYSSASETEIVELVNRDVFTTESANARIGVDENGEVAVVMYRDELLKTDDSKYSIYVAGFPYTDRLTINIQKETLGAQGNTIQSISSVEHKAYLSYSDVQNSIHIECNK